VRAQGFLFLLTTIVVVHAKADPVGCYAVFVGETSSSSPQSRKPVHLVRVKDIRLTLEHATTPWTGGQIFKVMPLTSADEFTYIASYWQLKRERLSIIWSNNGLSGVEMILTPTSNGFEGTIKNFWDFGPSTSDERPVVLTRRPC
jgi:hypothetical protein